MVADVTPELLLGGGTLALLAAMVIGTYWFRLGWNTPVGDWLCRHNRHHRAVMQTRPRCPRCKVPLDEARRRMLGWEVNR